MTSGNNNNNQAAPSGALAIAEDCSICLDQMTQADVDHPLQCSTHCGFNFCRNCIESLINSSKDDYVEASDGSRQVKVHLHCPNCRSDLSASIRDTVLLRKVADAKAAEANSSLPKTDSQRRTLEALETSAQVQEAVEEARQAERIYMRALDDHRAGSSGDDSDEDHATHRRRRESVHPAAALTDEEKKEMDTSDYSEYTEEWGVEADLNGVHGSFRAPRQPKHKEKLPVQVRKARIDTSLFGGLDYFMQDGEKFYITELMTSGDADKLAEAAELLHRIAEITRIPAISNGSSLSTAAANKGGKPPNRKRFSRCASIFQLIEESKTAHKKQDEKLKKIVKAATKPHHRQVQEWRRSATRRANQPPLPVRMPKYIEIHVTSKQHGIELCDDVWDGTVMDAYSKITVRQTFGRTAIYKKKQDSHAGVRSVMGQEGDVQIEFPGQKRVLVASLGPEAGAQGVMKGDVVTHINGAHVFDKPASEVNDFLEFLESDRKDEVVTVVFNAEQSVAEALKRRSFVEEP